MERKLENKLKGGEKKRKKGQESTNRYTRASPSAGKRRVPRTPFEVTAGSPLRHRDVVSSARNKTYSRSAPYILHLLVDT